jgi:hypothetical protein
MTDMRHPAAEGNFCDDRENTLKAAAVEDHT